jgi:hypothetical protein
MLRFNFRLATEFHHLYNIVNRQQSLRDICRTIKEKYFVAEEKLSDSLTILGVCNEKIGDKEVANYYYNAALQCEYRICRTAARRFVNLNMTTGGIVKLPPWTSGFSS